MKKFKRSIAALALILLFLPLNFVLAGAAQLEVTYPSLPGVGSITPGIKLEQYIQYVFIFAFMAAGIIGALAIVYYGFKILLYAGSPTKLGEAKEGIFNAILGIVILMASFILLRTINPSFINPSTIELPPTPGIYLVGYVSASEYFYEPAEQYVLDTTLLDPSYTKLVYYCPPSSNGPTLLLWKYNDTNFHIDGAANGGPDVTTIRIPCGNTSFYGSSSTGVVDITPSIFSFFWMYENAGVYYYMTDDCTGISSRFGANSAAQTISGDIPWFEDPLDNPGLDQAIGSIRILNNPSQNFNYGVVLTQDIGLQGECSEPIISSVPEQCIYMGDFFNYPQTFTLDGEIFNPYSAHIIRQDQNPNSNLHNRALTFWSNNKEFTIYQYGNTDLNINRNINFIWEYDFDTNNSPNPVFFPSSGFFGDPDYIPTAFYPNDGNLDNALRFWGAQANGGRPIPGYECLEYRENIPADQRLFDPTYNVPVDCPEGYTCRGYNSCLNKITWFGDYEVILYTHLESIGKRGCGVFSNPPLIYDPSSPRAYRDLPGIFTQYQTIYRTVVIPTR